MKTAHVATFGVKSGVIPGTGEFAHPARNVAALGVEPGMVVADFGSGSGAYVLAIADVLGGAGHIYAVDVQKDLLRRIHNEAHRRGFNFVSVLWGDLEKPHGSKLGAQTCDLVLISNLLFQVTHKEHLLKEAKRVLRPRGRLAIIDWQESYGGIGPIREHVVDKATALKLAENSGFDLVNEFDAGAHHYGLIFQKNNKK